ncbi:hypothetical protein N9189_01645 [Pirellulaceae bacterium]|nr:hypothetical protein [Pirellulaceae bacterium]
MFSCFQVFFFGDSTFFSAVMSSIGYDLAMQSIWKSCREMNRIPNRYCFALKLSICVAA